MTYVKKIAFGIFAVGIFAAAFLPMFAGTTVAQTSRSATTVGVQNVTSNSATLTGNSTFVPERAWFDFGTTSAMGYSIAANNGVGYATGLQPGKTYYYRYVAQVDGITCFGETKSFTTPPASCPVPVVSTGSASNVTANSATISGSKSGTVTRSWFDFGDTSSVPYSIADNGGVGQANGLQAGKTYYYRYVAQNDCGTVRGEIRSFTTTNTPPVCPKPTATTGAATNVGKYSATISGSKSGTVTRSWFDFGETTSMPYSITDNGGVGQANGLQPGRTYYYRYVTQNDCGTTYGEMRSFTTDRDTEPPQCPKPTATTGAATNVTRNSATISGNASDSSATWFEYGVSVSGFQRINTSASGGSVNLSGLSPNTTYSYRIVSQNNCGTIYGTIRTFTTPDVPQCPTPTAVTGSATNVTTNSATVSGTATNSNVTWIEYGTTVNNMQRVNVSATGGSVNLTGLSPNTTYTYRIVAQSDCGTVYGTFRTFTTDGTQCVAPTATVYQATGVGETSATISGVVNTQGRAGTYYFRYGTSSGNLNQMTPTQNVNGNQNVSYTLTGLQANTTYYFQLVVQTNCGTDSSNTLYFTTGTTQCLAPVVSLTNATNVGQNSAVVSGTVDPRGGTANYYFQYGTDQYNLSNYTQTYSVSGGSQNVSATISNLQANTTYYFRLVAQNSCGTNQTQVSYFTTTGTNNPPTCQAPTVSVYAASNISQNSATLNGTVNANGYPTTYWFQYGTNYSMGYTSPTQGPIYGSQSVSAPIYSLANNTNYYFNIVAQNQCGTTYGQSTLQFNTGGQQQGQGPIATTDPATSIGSTSAVLNGRVNPNGSTATAWFEWGSTMSLGYVTNSQSIGSGNSYASLSMPLSGLQPGRTYYFRVVGQNQYGTAQGQILSFTTGTGGTVVNNQPPVYTYRPPVVVTTVTGGIAGTSCLVLTPAIQPSNPIPGGEFTYSVTYRNDCPFDLYNASLRNYMPNEVDFSATSYPFVTRDLNVITYSLGTIPRGFQNTILVKGLVKPIVMPGNNLAFKSDLSFTDQRGQIQTVSAFLTATAAAVGVVTASVFDTLMRFLSSGWFWFLLFLLLLAMFVLWLASRRRHEEDIEHA